MKHLLLSLLLIGSISCFAQEDKTKKKDPPQQGKEITLDTVAVTRGAEWIQIGLHDYVKKSFQKVKEKSLDEGYSLYIQIVGTPPPPCGNPPKPPCR